MLAPYYCANCKEPVTLTVRMSGPLPDGEKETLAVACDCTAKTPTSLTILGGSGTVPDTWQANFDESREENGGDE